MSALILRELLSSIEARFDGREPPPVRSIHPPPGGSGERTSPFTLVVLDASPVAAGVCYNLLEERAARERFDGLDLAALAARGDALELAGRVLDDDPVDRVVGYAACHALSQFLFRERRAAAEPAGGWSESEEDLLQLLRLSSEDHVGLVGFAPPMVKRLGRAGAGTVTVLERPERARQISDPRGADITTEPGDLASCNKVLLTSTTLLNDSFDELDRLTGGAEFRALYGPGASVLPDALFARGIDALAGLVVTDAEALIERQLGGRRWRDAKRKLLFLNAGE